MFRIIQGKYSPDGRTAIDYVGYVCTHEPWRSDGVIPGLEWMNACACGMNISCTVCGIGIGTDVCECNRNDPVQTPPDWFTQDPEYSGVVHGC